MRIRTEVLKTKEIRMRVYVWLCVAAAYSLSLMASTSIGMAFPSYNHQERLSEKSHWSGLASQIALYGPDRRKLLSIGGPSLHLSRDEMARMRGTTGYLHCGKDSRSAWGSASLVGDGSHIITVGHMFQDPETMALREPLDKCYFQVQDGHSPPVELAITAGGKSGLIMSSGFPADTSDFAVATLKTPITGVKPFPVDLSNEPLKPHDQTIVVSALNEGVRNPGFKQPSIQECRIENVNFVVTTVLDNSCDLMPGSSGSIHLKRMQDGTLVIKGIVVGGDGRIRVEKYDESKDQFSRSLGVDGDFLGSILAADPSIKAGQGAVR